MHEELQSEKMPFILEGDAFIFELNESLNTTIVKKAPKYLRKHASQKDYVLRRLLGHNFSFLGKDRGKNHRPFRSWWSQSRL